MVYFSYLKEAKGVGGVGTGLRIVSPAVPGQAGFGSGRALRRFRVALCQGRAAFVGGTLPERGKGQRRRVFHRLPAGLCFLPE